MAPPVTGGRATPIPPESYPGGTAGRLRRVRRVAWVLDRSIPVGKWRIGLDPILGLLPGVGDWAGAGISLYLLYEAARIGLPWRVLLRMSGNILLESVVGTVPFLGDLFDFAWQANTRNVQLIENHYRPNQQPRSFRRIWLALLVFAVLLLTLIGFLVYFLLKLLNSMLGAIYTA